MCGWGGVVHAEISFYRCRCVNVKGGRGRRKEKIKAASLCPRRRRHRLKKAKRQKGERAVDRGSILNCDHNNMAS
jgi:hypothetical protein